MSFFLICKQREAYELRISDWISDVFSSDLFTPSFAPREDYVQALARGVFVTVDSVEILHRWPELFRGRTIVLRIDPGFGHGHHEKVRTGGKGAKFGLELDRLPEFIAAADAIAARIGGQHSHSVTGILDAGPGPEGDRKRGAEEKRG